MASTGPRPRRVVAAMACLAIGLAACDPSEPTPTDSPSTGVGSTSATPATPPPESPSAKPTPSINQQDRDYAEAAAAITQANRIVDGAAMDGSAQVPEQLATYADPDGPYFEIQEVGLELLNNKKHRFSAASTVATVFPPRAGKYEQDRLTLYVCIDGRKVDVVDSGGKVISEGGLVAGHMTFRRTGPPDASGSRQWRVWGYEGKERGEGLEHVSTCKKDWR